ncbi:GGDEF domain-containing protein [Baekduia soli]|uniref:GGDEF domain-containing protein n=1 Tax=Baekduia soli TaxID=496014 RepID=A0A5B8U8V5_9ACTN|nr:GGDEF domain-containing protein [Baekduia soli]QEC49387.1 GGDEF domain-containing protein [Baekduia soli]
MPDPPDPGVAPRTWLCPDPADRVRAVDMEERLRPFRRASFVALGTALVVSGHWIGWWTLLPLALAILGFRVVDRHLPTAPRPERTIASAWVLAELAIAGSIALTGGPRSPAVAWLVIPLVTLPARFNSRAVGAGVALVWVLLLATTVGVDPGYAARHPEAIVMPAALLAAVALLSSALMNSDLEHRSSAVIDPLTGMLNRHALQTRIAELTQQAAILHEPVALVVGDLDHFKAVNDTHGHAAGDAVLRDVAYRLRKALRAHDLAYRLGGEEFLVILAGARPQYAAAVAETLRTAVAGAPAAGLDVTMSFGVSASEPGCFAYDAVFAAADQALYEAKEAGRDRVRVAAGPALAGLLAA